MAYDWKYISLGGVTRVNIETGEDIAHLSELDQKKWTTLSCPTKGLEFDQKTLELLDTDHDGHIKVPEIIAASQWLTACLKDNEDVIKGLPTICGNRIDASTSAGAELLAALKDVATAAAECDYSDELPMTAEILAGVSAHIQKVTDERAAAVGAELEKQNAAIVKPWTDNTDAVLAAVDNLSAKMADYFISCKMLRFLGRDNATIALEDQSLADKDTISSLPIAAANKEGVLSLKEDVNPCWSADIAVIASLGYEKLTEDVWAQITAAAAGYRNSLTEAVANAEAKVAPLPDFAPLTVAVSLLDRFITLQQNFFSLVKNYVVFSDFYNRFNGTLAVFQAGSLYIDQRCCDLCIKVADMGSHADMAAMSGMYLMYCACVNEKGETMDIVAVLTDGEVFGLRVGKNAIFYDRNNQAWDAKVTKIVDNPISIRQAFWTPYRKLGNWISERIAKATAD